MTLFSVEGKTVVVTGGSRGIGRMIAAGFVAAGATVHISARKTAEVEKTAAELGCSGVPADLSTPEGVEHLVAAVDGPLHVLVNNAGATWGAPLEDYPEHAFDKLWNINVKGVFYLTQKFLPQLREAATAEDPARVINVGSVDGIKVPGLPTYAYSSTKSAVHMLTRHLARHLAPEHVTVNAIAPGPFDSKMMAFALDDPATRQSVASSVPLGRIGRPDDMAGTAIFLSSRAGAYLTGAVIPVDGGITC
ncbi:SDR family oxidoreductase [Nonomuraea jiangxiensis]|uniref:NAD(P)-dependent dehydrogenase, short-chain alcohol dehydrogenase family n=1 Tax=Nonomuraea jiangxiensis TaxID=633440 RepID=A0A1G9NQ14_9ACTN|nr:SDR family oxidoreductase [Nonomuraea jiangxiensis]SDL88393.1 NAD(P)-dependent dehydrogenase, short-chain alcohol dehydrogenase family [Nonomuraea jiangxiensis]